MWFERKKMRGKKNYSKYLTLAIIALVAILAISGVIRGDRIQQIQTSNNQLFPQGDYVQYIPEKNNPVDENAVQKIIYVDQNHPNASDSNPGKEELPLLTLEQAAKIALKNYQNKIGTKTIVYPGVYRESIKLSVGDSPLNTPIIFEAKEAGSVIISGSDIWQDWQQDRENPKLYTHDWPYDWGVTDNPWPERIDVAPIVRRNETIFVNGKLLRQKLSFNELTEGSFYVSEEKDTVYIYPNSGTDIQKSTIEVGTRNTLFLIKGVRNLVLRGFNFQQANSQFHKTPAVTIRNSFNILVENSQFLWNNTVGLQIAQCENVIVRKVTANHNGIAGMTGNRLKNAFYEDVESSYNNWRGDWGGFYSWGPGQKFLFLRNTTFRRYKAVGNQASGLWLDFDNTGVWIDDAEICDNFHTGLYIEASHHILVTNSKICHNRANPESSFHHPGILGTTSSYVTLENNIICGNDRSQIKVQIVKHYGGRIVTNWETEEEYVLISQKWVLRKNIIVGEKADQMLLFFQPNTKGFTDNLFSEGNIWYNPEKKQVFQIGVRNRDQKDFKKWQELTGQEQTSVFASPEENYSCGKS